MMQWMYRTLTMLLVGAALVSPSAAQNVRLIYPPPVSTNDKRSDYPLALLKLALSKSGQHYDLLPFHESMNKARATKLLQQGKLDVAWMTSSLEREQSLRAIRICLFKGLSGWRLALIRPESQTTFAGITRPEQLQHLAVGQQEDWADVPVMRHAGFHVVTISKYDQLFTMLQMRRFDWMSRNVLEIWDEEQTYHRSGLIIEPHLLIRYPLAYYFFVNPKNETLAQQIEQGLTAAIDDGSFDRLFNIFYGSALRKARLNERTVITLPNPEQSRIKLLRAPQYAVPSTQ